jgi:hypothetical protein
MSFLAMAGLVLWAAGLFAAILGAWVIYAVRHNRHAAQALFKEMQADTTRLLAAMDRHTEERDRDLRRRIDGEAAGDEEP